MTNFIQKFKDLFRKSEDIEEEDIKIEEKKRLDSLHKQARTQLKKGKKGLTIEDFERAKQTKKKKEPKKPVSYTF